VGATDHPDLYQFPSLNPIENAFSKLKGQLRKEAARAVDGLWAAVGRLLDEFHPTSAGTTSGTADTPPTAGRAAPANHGGHLWSANGIDRQGFVAVG
jgi:hypothetical protein